MFADTHKIIGLNIYENILDNYDLKLDKNKLLWGSIAPDILPKYKLIRHYKDESLDYIVYHIKRVIFMSRYVNFRNVEYLSIKILSREIGIISHYLSDFVCAAHANRWTFIGNMKKHITYETKLNKYVKTHDFKKHVISTQDIDLYDNGDKDLEVQVRDYINMIIEEYSNLNSSFNKDLNFALDFTTKISLFILETISVYSEELQLQFSLAT